MGYAKFGRALDGGGRTLIRVSFDVLPAGQTAQQLVARLADVHRRVAAYGRLLALGAVARPAIRAGLAHPHAVVREQCCKLLDHLMDADTVADLIAMLGDPEPRVRIAAAHALACERCKQNSCRPDADDVLPPALRLLANDPDPHVRAMAIEVIGQWVHQDARSRLALTSVRDHDTDPAVRKKAAWYLPGGAVYRRMAPR